MGDPHSAAPDARFHARVRALVAIHGPADALEPRRAARMAAEVLVHGLVEANNRAAAGDALVDVALVAELPPFVREAVGEVTGAIVAGRLRDPTAAGARIAHACFRAARRASFLDTDEIPLLVTTAYGVAIATHRRDPDAARRIVLGPD